MFTTSNHLACQLITHHNLCNNGYNHKIMSYIHTWCDPWRSASSISCSKISMVSLIFFIFEQSLHGNNDWLLYWMKVFSCRNKLLQISERQEVWDQKLHVACPLERPPSLSLGKKSSTVSVWRLHCTSVLPVEEDAWSSQLIALLHLS